MSYATPFVPGFDYTNFQTGNPSTPLPADRLESDLNNIRTTTDEIIANLQKIQRSDDALANNSVGIDQLKPEISLGLNSVTNWTTGTNYVVNDGVYFDAAVYRCLIAHQASVFATDLAAGRWQLIVDHKQFIDQAEDAATDAQTAQAASELARDQAQDTRGIRYDFDTGTAMADPGAGLLRFNNAAFGSTTAVAFAAESATSGNPSMSAFINTWDDSTSTVTGIITVFKASAPENFVIFNVTGVTDNTGWLEVAVTHVGSAGSFVNTDELAILFTRTGDKGDAGSTGATGPQGPQGIQGVPGADGADGTNGVDGTDGVDGQGWTGGSYDAGTGTVTFASTDGLGFTTGDLRGADGTGTGDMLGANNLSELTNAATARGNLGLGDLSTLNTVGTSEIDASSVTAGKIASNAVTTAKINAAAVTQAKIADGAVSHAKLNQTFVNSLTSQPVPTILDEVLIGDVLASNQIKKTTIGAVATAILPLVPSGGAWTVIDEVAVSGSPTSVTLTAPNPLNYKHIMILWDDVQIDNQNLIMSFRNQASGHFGSNRLYQTNGASLTVTSGNHSSNTSSVICGIATSLGAGLNAGRMLLQNIGDSGRPSFIWEGTNDQNSSTGAAYNKGFGFYNSTSLGFAGATFVFYRADGSAFPGGNFTLLGI